MPDAGTRTAPDYLVVVFPPSACGSCAGEGAVALASLSGDLTLPAWEGYALAKPPFPGRLPKLLCAMGLTLAATAKTSVLIPDRLWHSGVGAAAAHRGPLSASHHLSTIEKKQSEAASPLLFEIFEPKSYKNFQIPDFLERTLRNSKISGPRIAPIYSSTTLLLRSSCIGPAAKNEFQRAIAEQRQKFEARLKAQAPKIRQVNARFELKKLSIPTLADSQ